MSKWQESHYFLVSLQLISGLFWLSKNLYTETLKKLPGRMVYITAQGTNGYDCISRCFGPKIEIPEDPICGSAHCQIIPYWSKRLGKETINAWEASPRGGYLQGEIINDKQIILRGKAVLFSQSNINV